MAHLYVRNSLNYSKAVKINISFVRGYGVAANDGDPIWLMELATTYKSASGGKVLPQYINHTEDRTELDSLIAEAVAGIASQIDWSPLEDDKEAPYIQSTWPIMSSGGVAIESNVNIVVKDDIASSGLDLSAAVITINNGTTIFDITDSCIIEGTPFEYEIRWEPPDRKYEYYGG